MLKLFSGKFYIQKWTGVSWIHPMSNKSNQKVLDRDIGSAAAASSDDRKVNYFLTWTSYFLIWTRDKPSKQRRQLTISKREFQCCFMSDISQQIFHKRHNHKFVSRKITWLSSEILKSSCSSQNISSFIHPTG